MSEIKTDGLTGPEPQDQKRQIFAGDLWAVFSADSPFARHKNFLARSPSALKQFVHSLLLYKEVVLPTQDFVNLVVLVQTFGEHAVLEMLEADRLSFIRFPSALVYGGNGGGLASIGLSTADGKQDPMCAPSDAAVEGIFNFLHASTIDPKLVQLVLQKTTEANVSEVMEAVRRETYKDILESCCLRNYFAKHNTNLDHLRGIEPNQVRVYDTNRSWNMDEISIVLAMAKANLELRLGELASCSDSSTATPITQLMTAKAERTFDGSHAAESFTTLCEIADIPDIGEAVLKEQIALKDLLRLSTTRDSEQFQDWFHSNCRDNPISTAKEYAKLLRDASRIQTLPAKIIRFVVTSGVGMIPIVGPAVGLVAGAVDSFFIERLLRGSSPKFFIEDLRQYRTANKD